MQVEGVNAVSVSSGSGRISPAQAGDINPAANVESSNNSNVNYDSTNNEEIEGGGAPPQGAPKPLKSMSTSDFLTLHNSSITNQEDNVMNQMMRILEAVLALKLLDETLKSAQDSTKGNNFKDIA